MSMGLRLEALRAAGAPLKQVTFPLHLANIINCHFTSRTLSHPPRSERSQEMTLQYYNAGKNKTIFVTFFRIIVRFCPGPMSGSGDWATTPYLYDLK